MVEPGLPGGTEGSSVGESRQRFADWARSWQRAGWRERWLRPLLITAPVPALLLAAAAVLSFGPSCAEGRRVAAVEELARRAKDCQPFRGQMAWTAPTGDARALVTALAVPGPKEQALRNARQALLALAGVTEAPDTTGRDRMRVHAWQCPPIGATLDGVPPKALERGELVEVLVAHPGEDFVEEGALRILAALCDGRPQHCKKQAVADAFAVLLRSPRAATKRRALEVIDKAPPSMQLKQRLWTERLQAEVDTPP